MLTATVTAREIPRTQFLSSVQKNVHNNDPNPKELKKFARQFSKEDWEFLCDLDIFNWILMRDIEYAEKFARDILLAKRLMVAEAIDLGLF